MPSVVNAGYTTLHSGAAFATDPRAVEVVRAQQLCQPAIEALHYAAGLWRLRLGQPMLNTQRQAQRIKRMLTGSRSGALAKQAIQR